MVMSLVPDQGSSTTVVVLRGARAVSSNLNEVLASVKE
jgi:hypothetical protein